MGSVRRPARATGAIVSRIALVAALVSGVTGGAAAQYGGGGGGGGGVMLQGIVDMELWKTDSGSTLLTRNYGRPAALGRLVLWAAAEPLPGFVLYAQGQIEGGSARAEEGTELYADQVGIRYTRSSALVLDVGKQPSAVGAFAPRRFSNRNPLIGVPDGYPLQYPYGVQLSGTIRRFDYRAAVQTLPIYHEGYVPEPTARPRPAVGAGVTLMTGLRIGGSATWGTYLNDTLTSGQLAGRPWTDYRQRIAAMDLQFERGYLEVRGEMGWSRYDVPKRADPVSGFLWYLEPKYTFTPRLFVAARIERNDYPFIRPINSPAGPAWIANPTNLWDGEIGAGFRVTSSTLVKASFRKDDWRVPAARRAILPNGNAFAMQLSQSFDLMELVARRGGGY